LFFLFIGGTEICKVPGLSAAGANPAAIPFTSPADADLLWWGRPRVIDVVPVDPQGHPTPGIITRAARLEADFPVGIVRGGSFMPPACPYWDIGTEPGADPRVEPAVPRAERIFEAARTMAESVGRLTGRFVLGESVPGGTTTAMLLLRALGRGAKVSSAGPVNPESLKETVWREAAERAGIGYGGLAGRGLTAVRELGDPMQAAVAGFAAGLPASAEVVLAGGTQMLAVAALIRDLGIDRPLLVATTRYVAEDPTADFASTAAALGVRTYAAPLSFAESPFPGLSDYEKGYVKEGVGAGGAVWYAQALGVPVERIVRRTEELYAEMTGAERP